MLLATFALVFSVGVKGHRLGKLSYITCPILHIVHFYFFFFLFLLSPNYSLQFYMNFPVDDLSAPFYMLTDKTDC